MELRIENETTVKDLQQQFNEFYPLLQIQIFDNHQMENKIGQKAHPDQLIKHLIKVCKPFILDITNDTTVEQLLKKFQELGLNVKVLRKSENLWITTTLTEDWTLPPKYGSHNDHFTFEHPLA